MKKKNDHNYYHMLEDLTEYSQKAAKMLQKFLNEYNSEKLPEMMEKMHEVEHGADQAKHKMIDLLVKEFITPIDREDIINISQEIDNITDAVEDVLLQLYMFNITEIREDVLRFADIIVDCCDMVVKLMKEFQNFRKSSTIKDMIIEINRLEGEGDKLYTATNHELYTNRPDPMKAYAWASVIDHLEKCCDACEHTSEGIEMVIMKNS